MDSQYLSPLPPQARGSNARPAIPPPAHIPSRSYESLREPYEQANSTLGPQDSGIIYHDPADDAIARHQIHSYCSHSHHHYNDFQSQLDCEQDRGRLAVRYASTDPGQARSLSQSSTWSYARSAPSLHPRHNSFCSIDQRTESYDSNVDHGPTAFEEEEAALEYAAQLAAARVANSKLTKSSIKTLSIFRGAASEPETTQDLGADCDKEEHGIEDEEDDHCLSGLCLPRSQFFQTSIICSNTMARDGFANERTFLSWLNSSTALCVVSLTFISRSFTLDAISENPQDPKSSDHKDRLSRAIGYVCFISAFFAATYSLLKYLRNIRRISTRYPFAQSGKWTFTVGMFIGSLIMLVLVLSYTRYL